MPVRDQICGGFKVAIARSTKCLAMGGKVALGFGLDVLQELESGRSWSVTNLGQKGNEIGRVDAKLSTISWCGIYAEPCENNLLL
jgi:hypothetical protein